LTRMIPALFCALLATTALGAEEVVTIPTRNDVSLSYLLVHDKSATPKIVMISFVGGYGAIDLVKRSEGHPPRFGPTANFLVRIRDQVADADMADVIVDSPSDKLPKGMPDEFRLGPDHLADIRALIDDVKKRFPNAKVYLVGTSRGTISAAALAAKLGDSVQGVILTSTVTNRDKTGEALSRFDFGTIKIPVLLVHHRDDGCATSPYSGAERLSKNFPLVSVSGGDPPQSQPCEAVSAHGYLGRETQVTQAMKSWMFGREFTRDIR
jgi:poly(3-hydroxybutyrate) depolymerase